MRSLFLKIFGIFWIAQSLIFVISTLYILRVHFPREGVAFEALDANLSSDASTAIAAYQRGGCPAFTEQTTAGVPQPTETFLFNASGDQVCHTSGILNLDNLGTHVPIRIQSEMIDGHYIWLVPQGQLIYGWLQPPFKHQPPPAWHQLLRFANPQLPVALAIGGLTTFFLTLLFTLPLKRLREATRSLAEGNLKVRVEESARSRAGKPVDDFQGLAQDFNHMAGRLDSLVTAQKLLLRDVSHELRSPLARLSVALELVREDAGPQFEEHFSRIERETEKLNSLIGQLLTISALDAREAANGFTPVSLNELCEAIVPDAAFEAQRRPCTIELIEEAKCTVQGDEHLLHRALENVVRNAIRYTEPDTQVTLRIGRRNGSTAVLDVEDHGPGIPADELANIFQPFYRIDRARSNSTGGFGVGLAIVDRAVRLHGGTVTALNRSSGGTTIRIELPLVKA